MTWTFAQILERGADAVAGRDSGKLELVHQEVIGTFHDLDELCARRIDRPSSQIDEDRNLGLTGDLCGQFVVWQTRTGENRQLLTANQRDVDIDARDAGLNEFFWFLTRDRVDRGVEC